MHVAKNFRFPEKARRNNIMGRVYTHLIIAKTGEVTSIDVIKGVHPLLDLEAIRVVSEIPDVVPPMQGDKPVPLSLTLPINVKIQ